MAEQMIGVVTTDSRKPVVLAAGEGVRIQILNEDGTVKSTEVDVKVPAGKSFSGNVMCFGQITDAA